jgi:hypothetical protein
MLNLAGLALAADYTWSFTTRNEADTVPPTIDVYLPANGSVEFDVAGILTATFSEQMNP